MNEYNLIGLSINDCGFVKIPEGKIVYLSHPFKKSKTFETEEDFVKYLSSLSKRDVFYDCDLYFKTMGEAIRYIKNEFVESCKNRDTSIDSKESRKQLLQYVSADDLRKFFTKFQGGVKSGRRNDLLGAEEFLKDYKILGLDKKFPEFSELENNLGKKLKNRKH